MRSSTLIAAAVLVATAGMTGCGHTRGGKSERSGEAMQPTREVPSSAEETAPLRAGDRMPAVEVAGMEGRAVSLSGLVSTKPALIIFYRGVWCPYCNTHLGALGTIEPQLLELGYQVLAISADRPEKLAETHEQFGFRYLLLSDSRMEAARAFGIAFKVDDATVQKYRGYGIDLEGASGRAHHMLPVPSVFIVGTDGVIRFAYCNPDYKVRMAPQDVLAAARGAVQ